MTKRLSLQLISTMLLLLIFSFGAISAEKAVSANTVNTTIAKDGVALPFIEGFEDQTFPPAGWTIYNVDGASPTWTQHVMFNHTEGGSNSAFHSYGSPNQDGWMVTPKIELPTEGPLYLSFWSFNADPSFYVKNSVLVSTGSGNPADNAFVEMWTEEYPEAEWKQYVVNLAAYAGEEVFIAFRYEGDFAHEWLVDDVSLGEDLDDAPHMVVHPTEVNQTLPAGGLGSKTFKISNNGILDLTYEVTIADGTNWLTLYPATGSVPGFSSKIVTLDFNAGTLPLGTYSTTLTVTSNDEDNPTETVTVTLNVMEAQDIKFTIMYDDYTFPTAISTDGMYVSGVDWGGEASYLWSSANGITFFPGDGQGVSSNGLVAGSFTGTYGGQSGVELAGIWNPETNEWQFLGENPNSTQGTAEWYNNGYGISADGKTVVGMQWYPSWTVKAFKWTEDEGYEMIGGTITSNSRANGISADGSVIYGWAEPLGPRTPVVWYNDEIIYIDNNKGGEAFGASVNGTYVTGNLDDKGFIWSKTKGTILFDNELVDGEIYPLEVLEDGTVFGYTVEGFPPMVDMRRAFVRHPNGVMETFNDYVIGRGWFDVEEWIFFAISAVTPDANMFVGSAQTPEGEWISFVLDFTSGTPSIQVSVTEIYQEMIYGEPETQTFTIDNVGEATLAYSIDVSYLDASDWLTVSPKSGTIPAENYNEITLTFDTDIVNNAEYHANLVITSNDSENASITIPVTLKVEVINSVPEIASAMISVYPNPASDMVTISSKESIEGITIVNVLGKTVYTRTAYGKEEMTIDVSQLEAGMYVIRVATNQKVYNQKLQIK